MQPWDNFEIEINRTETTPRRYESVMREVGKPPCHLAFGTWQEAFRAVAEEMIRRADFEPERNE